MYSRFSPNFVEACLRSELRKGDKIPCPKCGHEDVTFTDPRKWLSIAAITGVIAAGLLLVGQTALGQIVAIVAVGIIGGSLGTEPSYTCKHCGYGWRHRDALKWADAIKHDEESRAKGVGRNP
ncbi:MAG: hypothetical protein WD024_00685 [Bacillota bacterium]